MGKVVYIDSVRRFIKSTPVFRAKDVELIVGDTNYSSLLLHNLTRRGEIKRVTRGWYTVLDDPVVSVFTFRPSYLGLQEALSLRNLWEQETNVVIVSATRVRPGIRKIMGSPVIIHRISPNYFFGFDYLKYGDIFLPVSDVEKTLIDLVYFNELPGRDVLKRILSVADMDKLRLHLKNYSSAFIKRFHKLLNIREL